MANFIHLSNRVLLDMLRRAKAEAWEEGFIAGETRVATGGKFENPYRSESDSSDQVAAEVPGGGAGEANPV